MARGKHMDYIAQWEGTFLKLNKKLKLSKHSNGVSNFQYFLKIEECGTLKRQFASGRICNGRMKKRLANASNSVSTSFDDLIHHVSFTQNYFWDVFFARMATFVELLQTYPWLEAVMFSKVVNEIFRNAILSLHKEVEHCQGTVWGSVKKLAGEDRHNGLQSGPALDLWILAPACRAVQLSVILTYTS